MDTLQPQVIEWERIQGRLLSAAPRQGGIVLGLATGQQRRFASIGSAAGEKSEPEGAAFVRLGCVIKVFTASLMAMHVSRGDVGWNDSALSYIESPGAATRLPPEITLRHLLNHTHGLDDSLLVSAPPLRNGWLDVAALCAKLSSLPPLSPPGARCSYGNAGAWLAGAVLEKITGRRYGELVSATLFRSLEFVARAPTSSTHICPSVENHLEIRASDLLTLLETCFERAENDRKVARLGFHPRELMSNPIALPGWSPSEQGACLGWKSFGSGWFGHNSQLPGHTTVVRVHPKTHTAIILYGTSASTFAIFAKLFAGVLPEFSLSRVPRPLDTARDHAVALGGYEGSFANGALTVRVRNIDGTLHYQAVGNRIQPQEIHAAPRALLRVNDHLFLPAGRPFAPLPVLQFVPSPADRSFQHLWSGRNLLRRVG